MEGFCRACLNKFNDPTELLQYCESNRRLFVYCTGLQVKRNDIFTFQLCKECYLNLKFACKFKKQCRTSDKKFKSYLALKRDGESIDLNAYLKNIEDTLTLRLPVASRASTPVHQKNDDDDDNVSTCTSIQNFMSDMLQGEEMLPTEARIVREVIQEEADILDDSLDSHWLQDDMSVDNDLGMDFNFAGFSTPHSIDNDHCYTPRRLTNDKENETYFYTPKDTEHRLDETRMVHENDMPLLDIADNNIECTSSTFDQNIVHDNVEMNNSKLDGIVDEYEYITMDDLESGNSLECSDKLKNENNNITIIVNKEVASKVADSPLANELEYYMTNVQSNNLNSIKTRDNNVSKLKNSERNIDNICNNNESDIINQSLTKESAKLYQRKTIENMDSTLKCELDKYISEVELKRKLSRKSQNKSSKNVYGKCSIDRNLEMALRNDSQEFFLDQLLISPQKSIRSGASTPTINNILFGAFTPRESGTAGPNLCDNGVQQNTHDNNSDFTKEFLKDNYQTQSTPKKEFSRVRHGKDLNKLKELKIIQRKIIKGDISSDKLKKSKYRQGMKSNRGYKDINRLKKLMKFKNESESETSDIEMLDSEHEIMQDDNEKLTEFENHNETFSESIESDNGQSWKITDSINNEAIKLQRENHNITTDNENLASESEQIMELMNCRDDINHLPKNIDDDLDISMSNLLNFDDNQSIDLNVSIASDFLKEDKLDEDTEVKGDESLFKIPFSPPDNKYDLDKNLCKICDKKFKNRPSLKTHFVRVHKQQLPKAGRKKSNMCPKCGLVFNDVSNLNRHLYKQHEFIGIKCKYCTLEFPTQGRFNLHMRAHTSEVAEEKKKELAAKKEKEDAAARKETEDVAARKEKENKAVQKESEDTTDKNDKEDESATEEKEDLDKIKEKNLVSTNEKEDVASTNEKEVVAVITEKDVAATTEKEDFVANEKNKDDNKEIKEECKKKKCYVCPICGKELKSSGNYNVHLRRHNKEYTVTCEICDIGFIRKCDLNVHMNTHSDEYMFECQHCPKKYKTRNLLIGHMYRHMGKEKFRCEVCDQNFLTNQYLKQHYQTDKCKNNRKALEEVNEPTVVETTCKPLPYKLPEEPKEIMECAEKGEDGLNDVIEIKEEFVVTIKQEDIENEPCSTAMEEFVAFISNLEPTEGIDEN